MTREFWREKLPHYEPLISTLVLEEVRNTPNLVRRSALAEAIRGITVVEFDTEAKNLADEYISRGVFPSRYDLDAQHAAVATVCGALYLASWNYRHLVKVTTRREINLINALKGYGVIEIVTPMEL